MKKAYLLLGRNGDICNFLPVIQYEAEKNNYTPKLIVAKEYAPLVEGCSYVEPVIWDGGFIDYTNARIWAEKNVENYEIVNCSVVGKGYVFKPVCYSFVRESWNFANCPVPWGRLPLTFDKRNFAREKEVIKKLKIKTDRPIILTALNGYSSPFPFRWELFNYLKDSRELRAFNIVDISEYSAYRFYDMLVLLEIAHCLITIDSAYLHLAHAVKDLPVISLIADVHANNRWLESFWMPQHILRLKYQQSKNNFAFIRDVAKSGRSFDRTPKIHCITSSGKNNPDAERRFKIARATWVEEAEYSKNWNIVDFPDKLVEKRNATNVGDTVKMPYVKDMIDYISDRADENDILMICNSDISFVPGITGLILQDVYEYNAIFFYRRDFKKINYPVVSEGQIVDGQWYCGSDAFAFTKKWWLENGDTFYDMIFGRVAWDLIMRNTIKRAKGVEINNAIYHERHDSFWERSGNYNVGGNVHNRKLAGKWLDTYGGDANDWRPNLKLVYK